MLPSILSSSFLLLCVSLSSGQHEPIFLKHPVSPRFFLIKLQPTGQSISCTPTIQNFNGNGNCVGLFTCFLNSGSLAGKCGLGLKTCCVVASSSASTSLVNAVFRGNGESSGTFTVRRFSSAFCQLRIDFDNFNIGSIDRVGGCIAGSWSLSGQIETNVPTLCGENSGQHMYVTFNDGNPITQSITNAVSESWTIRTTQIACTDTENLAPSGCLQFFNANVGSVKSFGFEENALIASAETTTQLPNLDYTVCVGSSSSVAGTVVWRKPILATNRYFTVTSRVSLISDTSLLGTVALSEIDADCTTDYVGIPSGTFQDFFGASATASRFCGLGFPTSVTSNSKRLQVVTNSNELPDGENLGFFLSFIAT